MILEVAVLSVKKELQVSFEKDFKKAGEFICVTPGYIRHSLQKCMEEEEKYILLVEWKTLEAHNIGFRQSPQYQHWKALLHHYYDPFPAVEHYTTVIKNEGTKQ